MKKLPKISQTLDTAGISHVKNIEIGGGENPLYPKYAQVDIRKLPKLNIITMPELYLFHQIQF